ncbi:MAG: formyl transferase [Deltaproteobacteria bacterium]|nr:formyl transferase [Deltaproteobacteria bacterium]
MEKTPLYDPRSGVMRVAGFMSGSGTNLRRILEYEGELEAEGGCPFRVVVIFSDSCNSNAVKIGEDFDRPVITRDITAYYRVRGRKKKDLTIRPGFDEATVRALQPWKISVLAFAGYMSIASPILTTTYVGVNVHPADLSIKEHGHRKYVGDHAVRDAILAGEKTISATTHLVSDEVDGGRLLMISRPVQVRVPPGADLGDASLLARVEIENQDRLKEAGDWVVFPETLRYMAEGRYTVGEQGRLFLDGEAIPAGYRLV